MENPSFILVTLNLIDMEGIRNDLWLTLHIIERVEQDHSDQRSYDYLEMAVFNTSILVHYRRAFASGARSEQSKRLRESLTDELKADHEYFFDLCSKHIAHSVNIYERGLLHAHYIEGLENEGITSVSVGDARVVGMSSKELSKLRTLVEFFQARLEEFIRDEKARLLRFFREIPIANLQQWEEPPVVMVCCPSTVKRSRRKR
jgi:hypothetical protein